MERAESLKLIREKERRSNNMSIYCVNIMNK